MGHEAAVEAYLRVISVFVKNTTHQTDSQIIIPQISIFPCCLGLLNFAKPIFIPFTVVQEEIE